MRDGAAGLRRQLVRNVAERAPQPAVGVGVSALQAAHDQQPPARAAIDAEIILDLTLPSLQQLGSTFRQLSCGITWRVGYWPAGSGSGLAACSTAVAWGERRPVRSACACTTSTELRSGACRCSFWRWRGGSLGLQLSWHSGRAHSRSAATPWLCLHGTGSGGFFWSLCANTRTWCSAAYVSTKSLLRCSPSEPDAH